jgi:hypothetical protein
VDAREGCLRFRLELGLMHYDLERVVFCQSHVAGRVRQNLEVLGSVSLVASR